VSISLPGLARFGCDLSATVGGIPDFGPAFRSRGSGHKNTREKRGPNGCGHRRAAGWCYFARGLAWVFINQPRSLGWIHGLDRHLRRLTIGAFAGTRNPATRNPSLLRRVRSANGHSDHNFECILLCGALATAGRRRLAGSQNRPIHPTQRQFTSWALWPPTLP
jgi:hypothetical protein